MKREGPDSRPRSHSSLPPFQRSIDHWPYLRIIQICFYLPRKSPSPRPSLSSFFCIFFGHHTFNDWSANPAQIYLWTVRPAFTQSSYNECIGRKLKKRAFIIDRIYGSFEFVLFTYEIAIAPGERERVGHTFNDRVFKVLGPVHFHVGFTFNDLSSKTFFVNLFLRPPSFSVE